MEQRTAPLRQLEEDFAEDDEVWRCSKNVCDGLPRMKRIIHFAVKKTASDRTRYLRGTVLCFPFL